jgi:hypothetical protein
VSIENIWLAEGRPVDVFKAKAGNLDMYTGVSGKFDNGKIVANVVSEKAKEIKPGQMFITKIGLAGVVEKISKKPSRLSGLHSAVLSVYKGKTDTGSIVSVDIVTFTHTNTVLVLSECVIDDKYVFVVNDGKLFKRDILVTADNGKYTALLSGVSPGEQVVITYSDIYTHGEKVSIHKEKGE